MGWKQIGGSVLKRLVFILQQTTLLLMRLVLVMLHMCGFINCSSTKLAIAYFRTEREILFYL